MPEASSPEPRPSIYLTGPTGFGPSSPVQRLVHKAMAALLQTQLTALPSDDLGPHPGPVPGRTLIDASTAVVVDLSTPHSAYPDPRTVRELAYAIAQGKTVGAFSLGIDRARPISHFGIANDTLIRNALERTNTTLHAAIPSVHPSFEAALTDVMLRGRFPVREFPPRERDAVQNHKYEILPDRPLRINDKTLYQIRALRDVRDDVPAGTLGGYVESEKNLSIHGAAWIADDALAMDAARVSGDALISGNVRLQDSACVCGRAHLSGHIQASEHVYISGATRLDGHDILSGATDIHNNNRLRTPQAQTADLDRDPNRPSVAPPIVFADNARDRAADPALISHVKDRLVALNYPLRDIRENTTPWSYLNGQVLAADDHHAAIETGNGTFRVVQQCDLTKRLCENDSVYLRNEGSSIYSLIDYSARREASQTMQR